MHRNIISNRCQELRPPINPLRESLAVWLQGGLNFHSAKTGVLLAAQEMLNRGLLNG